jgi:DNA processing protein
MGERSTIQELRKRLIRIHHCRGVGWKSISLFLQFDPTLESIFEMFPQQLIHNFHLKEAHANQFHHDLHNSWFETEIETYTRMEVHATTLLDNDYPEVLKEIYDPPWVLYTKGRTDLLSFPKLLSVVGTRYPSQVGLRSMGKVLLPLIQQNWGIVSGLAYGVDIESHKLAMRNNGITIAVLGSGFHHVYPKNHLSIAQSIARDHLLVSEYPPYQKPNKWQFPMRNRIISGLTKGTLIIEAKEKSGSLITGDQALNQGREVFAIPGSILEQRSIGTNKLIQQGAKLVMTAEDITNELI